MKTVTIALGNKEKKRSEKITDRVKTFEDACRELGIDPSSIIEVSTSAKELESDLKSIANYSKLIIITRALNEDWEADFADPNQYKYYPYFRHKAGFGLSCLGFDGWDTYTVAGSRLCFKSSELAEYAGKQFETIYQEFLTK